MHRSIFSIFLFLIFCVICDARIFKLTPTDSVMGDRLGLKVAIDGDTAICSNKRGKVYVFVQSPHGWVQQAILIADDVTDEDQFGESIAIDKNIVVIGAPKNSAVAEKSGAVYIFERENENWKLQKKLIAEDLIAEDRFGISVDLDGDELIVGSHLNNTPDQDTGAVYVFVRQSDNWIQQAKLLAIDRSRFDWFGYSVAIDGDAAVIGAVRRDSRKGESEDSGTVYVFRRSGTIWSQESRLIGYDTDKNDHFGFDVDIEGDRIIVGAPDRNPNGSAYIFEKIDGIWRQKGDHLRQIKPQDKFFAEFGISVSLIGNTAVVGARLTKTHRGDSGAVYTFSKYGAFWAQQDRLVPMDGIDDDFFGTDVAIDGKQILIGSPSHDVGGEDSGACYIFERNGAKWFQQAKLIDNRTVIEDAFGYAVAIDGETAIIGAIQDDSAGINAGVAHVFVSRIVDNPDGSTREIWTRQAKLIGDDTNFGDHFGCAVAIDGDTAIVGAFGHEDLTNANSGAGAVYVFDRIGESWTQSAKLMTPPIGTNANFGFSLDIDGDQIIIGAPGADLFGTDRGFAYIFDRVGNGWIENAKLEISEPFDHFGHSVALSGDRAIVGAHGNDDAGLDSGSAYIFVKSGDRWLKQTQLIAHDAAVNDWFGYAVDLDGNTAIVGAWRDDHAGVDTGSAYVFIHAGGAKWRQQSKLFARDPEIGDGFGISVAISKDTAIIGAWKDDILPANGKAEDLKIDQGSIYAFTRTGIFWSDKGKRSDGNGGAFDHFGRSIAISDDRVMAGAEGNDDLGSNAGAAYIYSAADLGFFFESTFAVEPSNSTNLTIFGKVKSETDLIKIDQTILFQNYPNPFNPETWIPFQLSRSDFIVLKIYHSNGKLIREINVGYKPIGIYRDRANAIYWDGKNESGEIVSSGVYFYQLIAGDFSSIRRMIVLR